MKRLALSALSVCAISFLSGCCWWPGYWGCGTGCSPYGGGGCPNGQCAPGGGYPSVAPTGFQNTGFQTIQSSYPVATQPVYTNTVAYPQPVYPTMALESLPTYR